MQTGTLSIYRRDQNINKLVKISIYLDGKLLHTLANNETKSFEIDEGNHVLSAKIDWGRSNKLPITIRAGETKNVEMGSPVDVSLKPVSLLAELGVLLLLPLLAEYLEINLGPIILTMITCWLIWMVFISKKKPLIYYLTFGYKEYLYLRDIN